MESLDASAINIKHIAADRPRVIDGRFDASNLLTPGHWSKFQVLDDEAKEYRDWENAAYIEVPMVIVRPSAAESMRADGRTADGIIGVLKTIHLKELEEDHEKFYKAADQYLEYSSALRQLDPERFNAVAHDSFAITATNALLHTRRMFQIHDSNISLIAAISAQARIVFVDAINELDIRLEDAKSAQYLLRTFDANKGFSNWATFARFAANARIAWEDEHAHHPTPEQWRGMTAEVKDLLAKGPFGSALVMVANMKILAAQSIKITQQGLVLEMPPDKFEQENKSPIPETRKF